MSTIHTHRPVSTRRHLRSFTGIALIATIAVGAAACGDKVDEVAPAAAQAPSARSNGNPYQESHVDFQTEALRRDVLARRLAAAAGSDRHLELLNNEIADKVPPSQRGWAGRSRVKAV